MNETPQLAVWLVVSGKSLDKVLDIRNTEEVFYLLPWIFWDKYEKVLVRWTGKRYVPEGCCNTRYILEVVETGEEIEVLAESYIERLKDLGTGR